MKLLYFIFIFHSVAVFSQNTIKKVKYRKHTEFNFSGDQIDGKIRSSGIFYIFKRKQSEEHASYPIPGDVDLIEKSAVNLVGEKLK